LASRSRIFCWRDINYPGEGHADGDDRYQDGRQRIDVGNFTADGVPLKRTTIGQRTGAPGPADDETGDDEVVGVDNVKGLAASPYISAGNNDRQRDQEKHLERARTPASMAASLKRVRRVARQGAI
jgi:hypothetical protein